MSSVFDSLLFLSEAREEEYFNGVPLNDHIQSLELGLVFLEKIWYISDDKDLDYRIEAVVSNVVEELSSLSNTPRDENLILDLDRVFTNLVEMMKNVDINRESRVVYNELEELSSLSNTPTGGSLVLEFDRTFTNLREKMKNVIINPENREYHVIFPNIRGGKSFRRFYGFLVGVYENLSQYKAGLISPLILERLLLLETFLTYLVNVWNHGRCQELTVTLQALIDKSACLVYSCVVDKMDGEMELAMNHNLSDLLEKNKVKNIYIEFFRTSRFWDPSRNLLENEMYLLDSLIKILESKTSFVAYLNDSSTKLHEKLKFLKSTLADLPREVIVEKFNYLITSTEAIISGIIPIIYTCYDEDMIEETYREVNASILELLDLIEHIQVEVKEVREMKLYNYSKTDELGFLDLFLEHLEKLTNCLPEYANILENEIGELCGAFDSLRSFLRKIEKQRYEHEEMESLWTRIIGLAHQAEYIIDFFLVKKASDSRIMFSISNVIKKTKLIMSEVEGIDDMEKYHTQSHGVPKSSDELPSQTTETTTDKVVVGFEDEAEKIRGHLLGDSKKRDVISIVGMPGLGKTTLAKKMYEDPSLIELFRIRAWCTVSQTYDKEKMLLSLLADVDIDPDEMKKLEGLESDEKLKKILLGRPYFIVLDDVWDINVWTDLVRSLPDDSNHSRVLITSRLNNVASQVKAGIVHSLRPFSDHESWELFQKKLLEKESFSQEFLDVGKEISTSCKGLPLSIVVAAGLLAKLEKNIHLWEEIAVNLSSHIFSDSETQCIAILERSFKELPDHLKSCFLYIAAFPEDAEIPVQKLIGLWIAEGFVRYSGEKSLEDVAEGYLINLINRSLLTAIKRSSLGGVKSCGVHDILRDFCLDKAEKDSFLQVVNKGVSASLSVVYDQRRISFCCDNKDLVKANPSSWSVRSLFHLYMKKERTAFLHQNFMLLRVLDMGYLHLDESLEGLIFLIHLRYLAFQSRGDEIPSTISNLSNLQHLRIGNYDGDKFIHVTDSLWDMVNLRNVNIDFHSIFELDRSKFNVDRTNSMQNIEILSSPFFRWAKDAEYLLERLPKLRKLKCSFKTEYSADVNLTFLHQLMSLKVSIYGERCKLNLPLNLQKLTLSGFGVYWGDISKIGRSLPKLKVLKLTGTFEEATWIVNEGDFPLLKYLKLSRQYLVIWIASENSFPILEQLVLDDCVGLKEIPPCFKEISTMHTITVRDCTRSVDDSAKEIQMEHQEEWQNEQLEVNIYPLKQDD